MVLPDSEPQKSFNQPQRSSDPGSIGSLDSLFEKSSDPGSLGSLVVDDQPQKYLTLEK